MMAFMLYQLKSYIRSLKIIPPAFIFLAWIFILYAYNNQPILSSYGVSSIALYLVITWITMTIFTLEEESEKHILFTHLGSKVKFIVGKWMAVMILMIPLLLFSTMYPILTKSFKGNFTLEVFSFILYSHVVFSFLGIIIGTLFSATQLTTKKYAWLSAVFIIVVSLASKSLMELSFILKFILWIFPPVYEVLNHMTGGDKILMQETLLRDGVFVVFYILIATLITIYLYKRKEC
jgi:hypothetical protein